MIPHLVDRQSTAFPIKLPPQNFAEIKALGWPLAILALYATVSSPTVTPASLKPLLAPVPEVFGQPLRDALPQPITIKLFSDHETKIGYQTHDSRSKLCRP